MKLLFVGSLVVLLSVVAWAAMDWAIEEMLSPSNRAESVEPISMRDLMNHELELKTEENRHMRAYISASG